jgi:hypothetical protein
VVLRALSEFPPDVTEAWVVPWHGQHGVVFVTASGDTGGVFVGSEAEARRVVIWLANCRARRAS